MNIQHIPIDTDRNERRRVHFSLPARPREIENLAYRVYIDLMLALGGVRADIIRLNEHLSSGEIDVTSQLDDMSQWISDITDAIEAAADREIEAREYDR